jgi:hypothetical protein
MRTFLTGVLVLLATPVFAGPFDEQAKKAHKVQGGPALAALFWAQTASCKGAADDFMRRQCEGVKEARGQVTSGQIYLIESDGGAISVGNFDKAKAGIPFTVRGCLACAQPVEFGADKRYVTTKGNTTVQGGALRGPEVYKGLYRVATDAQADRFLKTVVPRLETELLFKVPARADAWSEGGTRGYAVELVGVRVYDPCDGTIVHAQPAADKPAPDPAACAGEAVQPEKPKDDKPKDADKPKQPELPQRLSTSDIQNAMAPVRSEVNACFATYGVAGDEKVTLEITGDGALKSAKLTKDFIDTPTGECILRAVKKATFPKFKAASMTINFPFILR